MSVEQPDASSSAGVHPTIHRATFAFDAKLPRETFQKLVEANGTIHQLVQRLMEKHGGEEHLRFGLIISGHSHVTAVSSGRSSRSFQQDYLPPSSFLASLPKLSARFLPMGTAFVVGQDVLSPDSMWPSFEDGRQMDAVGEKRARKRKRRLDQKLMDEVANGIESLDIPGRGYTEPEALKAVCPSNAAPILSSLYAPPLTPPGTPPRSPQASPTQRYLILVQSAPEASETDKIETDLETITSGTMNVAWDGKTWDQLVEGCKEKSIRCSCVIVDSANKTEDGPIRKRLKTFCQSASSGRLDDAWFPVEADTDLVLSGFSVEQPPSPTPTATQAATAASDILVTPTSVPIETPVVSTNPAQTMMQQNMARMLQAHLARSGKTVNHKMMSNILLALNNGTMDPNSQHFQQIKHLLFLQSQQQAAQASMNPVAAAAAAASAASAANTSGLQNAAEQAAHGVHQQLQYPQQQLQQQLQQHQQQQQQPNVAIPQARPAPAKIWSGDLTWPMNNNGVTMNFRVTLDATQHSTGTPDPGVSIWPNELRIVRSVPITVIELQRYAKQHLTPCILFMPSVASSDPQNVPRYNQFAAHMVKHSLVFHIVIGSPDRGIILFPLQGGNAGGPVRLMGLVCLHVSVPTPTQQPTSEPQVQQQQIQQPQLPQPVQMNNNNNIPAQMSQNFVPSLPQGMQGQAHNNTAQFFTQQPVPAPHQYQPPPAPVEPPTQAQLILTMARRMGLPLPDNINPASLTEDQQRGLMQAIKAATGRQQQQSQLQQQQQQQQQAVRAAMQQFGSMQSGGMGLGLQYQQQ